MRNKNSSVFTAYKTLKQMVDTDVFLSKIVPPEVLRISLTKILHPDQPKN